VKPHRLPAWFRALRPRQWTKNIALFAALVFARRVFDGQAATRAVLAFVAFCLLSSGTYVFNDWMDREEDRRHPEKALRPIAAREIRARTVLLLIVICWAAGLDLGVVLGWKFALLGAGYLVLQLAYTFSLKHLVILDVLCIAAGFVLRVPAGGVVIEKRWSGLAQAVAARYVRQSLDGIVGDYWAVWPSVLMTESYHYAAGYGGANVLGITGRGKVRRAEFVARLATRGELRLACIDLEPKACAEHAAAEMAVPPLRYSELAPAEPMPDGHRLDYIAITAGEP